MLLILINLCGVVIMGYDKFLSKQPGAKRVSEKDLFLNALAGGAIGVYLGMNIFSHKTKHRLFKIGIPIIILAQVVLYLIVFYKQELFELIF